MTVEKFHKEYDKLKAKAVMERNVNKQKLFAAKGKGQWDLCKELGAKRTSPLIAVKRPSEGKQKQAKGTVATNPNEVDEILRKVLDKIYDGNAKEGGKLVENYLAD